VAQAAVRTAAHQNVRGVARIVVAR
jgi:hypothetical protein